MAENTNTERAGAHNMIALSPLPGADHHERVYGGHGQEIVYSYYSEHQMREYARQQVYRAEQAWQARASLSLPAVGQEPVASDGWLHENGLLYRLTDERHPCNRDEINVTMADGSRSIEARSRRALELLDRIRAAAPQPAVAAGWSEGIQAAAKLLEKKADDFAQQHGYDDMGALSFGRGAHADAKLDYHSGLLELAEEIRALPPAPSTEGESNG
jgi:hypothetical protein